MNQWMRAILESKRRERWRLRLLPLDEKIAILERMRVRALEIAEAPLPRRGVTRTAQPECPEQSHKKRQP